MSLLAEIKARLGNTAADLMARIVIAALPREKAAAIRVRFAQDLLERPYGNRQAHLEKAISLLEAAVRVLPSDPPLAAWIWGQRFLGEAYLYREAGDAADNIEQGIAALEAAQKWSAPADRDAWSVWQSNLGQAYARRLKGDRAENRIKAAAAFDAVLSLPREDGKPSPGWGHALAWFTTLAMVEEDHQFPNRPGLPRDAEEMPRDPDWHIPWYLDDAAHDLQQGLYAFLDSGIVHARDDSARLELESYRLTRIHEMVYQLDERRSARQRTEELFQRVHTDGQPFVLFLRGFNNRVTSRTAQGTMLIGTGNLESFALTHLVAGIGPMPVVWIQNPVESTAISQYVAEVEAAEMGFRVEAGEDWAQAVQALMVSASFIVMHNESMTPGVVAEIELLRDAGRLNDVFFEDVAAANQASNRTDCRPLDDRTLAMLAGHTTPRLPRVTLPPAMCPWTSGARRLQMERGAQAITLLHRLLAGEHHPMFMDLMLDVCAFLLSYHVILERREELAALFAQQAAIFEQLPGDFASLAAAYSQLAKQTAN